VHIYLHKIVVCFKIVASKSNANSFACREEYFAMMPIVIVACTGYILVRCIKISFPAEVLTYTCNQPYACMESVLKCHIHWHIR
jgi:hypothetical protein